MKKVSVVIPCRNEEKHIGSTVEHIFESDYKNLEVIVVDGMSDDGTREVLEELSKTYENFCFIDNPHKLTPFAFNLGVKRATGEYVQIVGSRNALSSNYISLMVSKLEDDPQMACVGGDYRHTFDSSMGKYISWAMESRFGVGASNYRTKKKSCYVDTVGVPMYRKRIFDELGYFDEELIRNQDDDFNFRVTQAGHKIYYAHEAHTSYVVRPNLKKLFNQFKQYGYFKVFVNKKHKAVTTLRQLVPLFFLGFIVIGGFLCFKIPDFWRYYMAIWGTYFFLGHKAVSPLSEDFYERRKTQFAIFTMHLGYGWGYLQGIIHFLILGRKPAGFMKVQTT